jgi:hypothetical protein
MLGVDCPSNTWFCVEQHLGLQGILNVLALSANSRQYLAGRIENLVFSHPAIWKNHKTQFSTRRPDIFADINNANPNIPAAKLTNSQ